MTSTARARSARGQSQVLLHGPDPYAAQAEEEAIALGFPSAHAAKQHSDWLAANGTLEYKAWLSRIPLPNAKASEAQEENDERRSP